MNSDSKRYRFLAVSLTLLVFAAIALFWLQHSEQLAGGAIAPSKLAWLITVLVFWYVLPVFWLLDISLVQQVKYASALFLLSMLLRALVELTMMYVTNNWLHLYGIAHDVVSVFLCFVTAGYLFRHHRKIAVYFCFCGTLFILETYFALYLREISEADGTVFFLESAPEHRSVLWLTRIAVVVSTIMYLYLTKRRSSASVKSRNQNP